MKKIMISKGTMPLICTPIVGTGGKQILDQLQGILEKQPDIIEWRADFFENLADTKAVIDVVRRIKALAGAIPLIFTIRSQQEGGQENPLADQEVIALNAAICKMGTVEYVDCELRHKPEQIEDLRHIASQTKTKIIGSYHNFQQTPSREAIIAKLAEAADKRLDIAKVAVMPQTMEDVLVLLSATLEANKRLSIPLITMSMGQYGMVSRMIGGVFGTSLTFAVGEQASAPGQIPIEDLRTVLQFVEKYYN